MAHLVMQSMYIREVEEDPKGRHRDRDRGDDPPEPQLDRSGGREAPDEETTRPTPAA